MFNRMDQNMNGGPADAVIGKIDDAQRGDGESGGFFSKHGDGEEFHIPGDTYMIFMEGIEGAECHGIGFQKDGLGGLSMRQYASAASTPPVMVPSPRMI